MGAFLTRLRRRLRAVWAVATATLAAPLVAAVALGTVAVGWWRPWGWPEPVAAGVVLVAAVAVVAAAAVQPLPAPVVARVADRGLATKDAFETAVEFRDRSDDFSVRIRDRAETLAGSSEPAAAAPWPWSPRRWLVAGLIALVALVLAVAPNPQDRVRAEQAAEQARLDTAADGLEEAAGEIGADPAGAAVADRLRELADELRSAEDLAAAQALLDRAQAELDAARPADQAAREAATTGLEQSLAQRPLAGGDGLSAAEQLAAAGEQVGGSSAVEQQALADRLADLAATQEAGNPALADALSSAATALAAGDVSGAQAALGEAAAAQTAGQAGLAAEAGRAEAAAAVSAASNGLSSAAPTLGGDGDEADGAGQGDGADQGDGAGQGQGAGQGDGAGQGSGQGQGAGQGQGDGAGQGQGAGQGDGAGQGSGQGQGGGQGQGSGSGSPSGQVAGAGGGTGQGQGGAGTPGGTDQRRVDTNNGATVVDPAALGSTDGDDVSLGGSPQGAPGQVVGRGDGPSTAAPARVPLSDVVGSFADQATAAVDRPQYAPSQRRLVGDYFDQLSQP
ncbi:MAG: hypothetical protein ACK5PP_05770 [Acidimicrobiales bacterium]